jgi:hypothetical protein
MSAKAPLFVALAAVGIPVLAGAILALIKPAAKPARISALCASAVAGLSLAMALAQSLRVPFGIVHLGLAWLPGAGSLALALAPPGLAVALATTIAFALAVCLDDAPFGLGLVCLGAANMALLAGDFLGRYVALEIVGLCVAAVHLVVSRGKGGARAARHTYMLLRLGDAGLLMAILLLWRLTGTLAIGDALGTATSFAGAAAGGPEASALAWIGAGLALAAWVKLGAWPMQVWLEPALDLSFLGRSWLYASVMPNLALYLLSRVSPLLAAIPVVSPVLRSAGLLAALAAGAGALVLARGGRWRRSLVYLGALQGGLAMMLAAAGQGQALVTVVVVVTPLRLALDAWVPSDEARHVAGHVSGGTRALGLAILGLLLIWIWALGQLFTTGFGWAAVGYVGLLPILGWGALALVLPHPAGEQRPVTASQGKVAHAGDGAAIDKLTRAANWWIERGVLGGLVTRVARGALLASRAAHGLVERRLLGGIEDGITGGVMGVSKAAHGLVEERLLGGLETGLARGVLKASQAAHLLVERGTLDGSLRVGARLVQSVSGHLQRRHTGRLRHNIAWLGVTLAALMVWVILG